MCPGFEKRECQEWLWFGCGADILLSAAWTTVAVTDQSEQITMFFGVPGVYCTERTERFLEAEQEASGLMN